MHTGIDIGLSVTSITTMDDNGKIISKCSFGYDLQKEFKKVAKEHPMVRYKLYSDYFESYFTSNKIVGTIVMEQPMGRFIGNAIKLADIRGCFFYVLNKLGYNPYKVYNPKPTEIKKYMTGKGTAKKEDMIEACKKRGYSPEHEHEADSISMCLMSVENSLALVN